MPPPLRPIVTMTAQKAMTTSVTGPRHLSISPDLRGCVSRRSQRRCQRKASKSGAGDDWRGWCKCDAGLDHHLDHGRRHQCPSTPPRPPPATTAGPASNCRDPRDECRGSSCRCSRSAQPNPVPPVKRSYPGTSVQLCPALRRFCDARLAQSCSGGLNARYIPFMDNVHYLRNILVNGALYPPSSGSRVHCFVPSSQWGLALERSSASKPGGLRLGGCFATRRSLASFDLGDTLTEFVEGG